MHSLLVDGPRNESGATLRVFDGLWSSLRMTPASYICIVDPVLSYQKGWIGWIPLVLHVNVWYIPGREGGHCHIGAKNITASYQPFLLSGSNVISPSFSGTQVLQASTSLSKNRLVFHSSMVDAHAVCTWAVFMQMRSFITSYPKTLLLPLGWGVANLASEKHLLFLQKVNCLSH